MSYYDLLQVSPQAPQEVIAAAYKALMRVHHPDKGGSPETARQLNEAFAVLSDPQKRAQYDATLRQQPRNPGWQQQPSIDPAWLAHQQQQMMAALYAQMSAQFQPPNVSQLQNSLGNRLMNFLDRLAARVDRDASAELDLDDPGQGTVYQMPTPRRRRRA